MGTRVWCGCAVLVCAMMFGVAAAQDGSGPQAAGARPSDAAVRVTQLEGNAPKVSFRWESIGAKNAFLELFKATNQPFVWAGRLEDSVPITATMAEVDLKTAVDLICQVAGLTYEQRNGAWVISQGPQMVTVGGMRVPVVGAVPGVPGESVFERRVGDETLLFTNPRIVRESMGGILSPSGPQHPAFKRENALIDLDVKDMPLGDVADQLSHRLPPVKLADLLKDDARWRDYQTMQGGGSLEIIVDESVRNLRVTAIVRKWPLGQVLDMLIDQGDLACSEEVIAGSGMGDWAQGTEEQTIVHPTITRLYLVPKPLLVVTGPGVPGWGGVGSGGGGGPVTGTRGGGGGGAAPD